MKIAVTGANGFIGQSIVAQLVQRGIETVAVVRTLSPTAEQAPMLQYVSLDINEAEIKQGDWFERLGQPDVLIHLAWGGLPNYHSLHHFENELSTQYRFLKNLIAAGLPSLIVAGTCFEYGAQSGLLQENMHTQPNNSYGFAKNTLRQQLGYLQHQYPFALTWARLFYLYGAHQAKNALFSQLQNAVANGDKIFNMSGGEQLRDYLSVQQASDYLIQLARQQTNVGVVNVCSGQPISIRRLVEQWVQEHKWQIDLNLGFYPYPDYEPMAFWGCTQKLKHQLNIAS